MIGNAGYVQNCSEMQECHTAFLYHKMHLRSISGFLANRRPLWVFFEEIAHGFLMPLKASEKHFQFTEKLSEANLKFLSKGLLMLQNTCGHNWKAILVTFRGPQWAPHMQVWNPHWVRSVGSMPVDKEDLLYFHPHIIDVLGIDVMDDSGLGHPVTCLILQQLVVKSTGSPLSAFQYNFQIIYCGNSSYFVQDTF